MTDLPKIVAACEFDGTEKSIQDFIPEGMFTVDKTTQKLKIKNNNDQTILADSGWYVIKDDLNSYITVEPAVYKSLYEHMLSDK